MVPIAVAQIVARWSLGESRQELAPEAGHAKVDLAPRPVVQRLTDGDEHRQPNRHRHEDEVKERRDAELGPSQVESRHEKDLRIRPSNRHQPFSERDLPRTTTYQTVFDTHLRDGSRSLTWAKVKGVRARPACHIQAGSLVSWSDARHPRASKGNER